jgi:hypothetical protein
MCDGDTGTELVLSQAPDRLHQWFEYLSAVGATADIEF